MARFGRAASAQYHDLFEAALANAVHAAELLQQLLENFPDDSGLMRQILLAEQEGDRITHAIIHLLGEGPKPPLPGASVHHLATTIDDIVDHIEEAADRFGLYKIEAPMDPSLAMAEVLAKATKELARALAASRRGDSMQEALVAVNRLENEGDQLSREAIGSLFAGGVDPMVVIRWKDIFDLLEQAIDSCEDVAHALQGSSFAG